MKRFEYNSHQTYHGLTQEQLKWYGENGWELVAISPESVYYFKREITPPTDESSK